MNALNKIVRYIVNPDYRCIVNNDHGLYKHISDEKVLRRLFKARVGKELDLDNPCTFNEKLQWLKLYDRNSEYTAMVDKYAVKNWVANRIGEEYIIPTFGVWECFDEIDFNDLPNQFVLKCTHDSGGLVIVKDKGKLDKKYAKQKIEKCLKRNYYWLGREWPYKNVPPRIIAEKYMSNSSAGMSKKNKGENYDECKPQALESSKDNLTDYKFMCFNGQVKCVFTVTERFTGEGLKVTFFDREWNPLPFERHYPKSEKPISKPHNFEKMIELAERLSENIPFVRVDFYESGERIYFGEMTFYPGGGFEEFTPDEWDKTLGDWINLPISTGGGTR